MRNKILRYKFIPQYFGASGSPSCLNIYFIQVQVNISIFPAGESPPPTVQTIKNTCTTPLSHIWSCHTERRDTPTPQMGSRLLKIYGMLRQICGQPWWTSSRLKWSLVMGRQMIVPYRLARMPVHALIWTVLCKIVVFKSPTQTHSEEGSLLDFNSVVVCACVCVYVWERGSERVCERFPGCLCCQEESVFLVTLSNTEFTARELCHRCDVLASKKAQDALFFFPFCISSHSISLTLLTAACVVYMYTKKKIKCSQSHPSVFLLCIHGNKNSLFCLLGLYQRCPRRLAHNCVWKQVSMLFLCTSPV